MQAFVVLLGFASLLATGFVVNFAVRCKGEGCWGVPLIGAPVLLGVGIAFCIGLLTWRSDRGRAQPFVPGFKPAVWFMGIVTALGAGLGLMIIVKLNQDRQRIKQHAAATALFKAAAHPDPTELASLIKKGAPLNIESDNTTALIASARAKNVAATQMLLAGGADPNWRTAADLSALSEAARVGAMDVVRALVSAHANVDAMGWTQRTALDEAVRSHQFDVATFLLQQGADLHALARGETALMKVARDVRGEDVTAIRFLLQAGADLNYVSPTCETALSISTSKHRTQIEQELLARGASAEAAQRCITAQNDARAKVSEVWAAAEVLEVKPGDLRQTLNGAKTSLVYFWYPNCDWCIQQNGSIPALAKRYQGRARVLAVELNKWDAPPDVEITAVPTFVVFAGSIERSRIEGYKEEAELMRLIDQNLP